MAQKPYVYISTRGASKDVSRNAPEGARVALHFPELGRSLELGCGPTGSWSLMEIGTPGGNLGPTVLLGAGTIGETRTACDLCGGTGNDPHSNDDCARCGGSGTDPETIARMVEAEDPGEPTHGDNLPRPEAIHRDDQPESGPAQRYYDHKRVPGDPLSELADALKARGWSCVIAHTGGGCMSVSVELDDHRSVLIGPDPPGGEGSLALATSGGLDVEDVKDPNGYLGSATVKCEAGAFIDAAEDALKAARDGSLELR